MSGISRETGVKTPEILLPAPGADFMKWAVVACDQFTAQPEYWEKAEQIVGESPSTLKLILPEAYLGKPGEPARIAAAKANMEAYLSSGVLQSRGEGFVLIKRRVGGRERLGLILALDLEQYDYHKGARTLIRATEGTIEDRIPPRLRIRSGAKVELPHILVLIDDPQRTVIEPLAEDTDSLLKLYDTELMLGGGHVEGFFINDGARIEAVQAALAALTDAQAFEKKFGPGHAPLLFAMGDGNHSFATAKAAWEAIKPTLSGDELMNHPARYALVEIENVHDESIVFEPIHRALFGVAPAAALERLEKLLAAANGGVTLTQVDVTASAIGVIGAGEGRTHVIPYMHSGGSGVIQVDNPAQQLCVGTLQNALDALVSENPAAEVDYIHGSDALSELAQKENTLCFLLPAMKKSELFPTVVYDGALPRKTFSMGEANEKRYYMECRRIAP